MICCGHARGCNLLRAKRVQRIVATSLVWAAPSERRQLRERGDAAAVTRRRGIGDRPLADAQDTVRSIGFDLGDVHIIPAFGKHSKILHTIMTEVQDYGAKLVLWEGFDMMVRSPNNPSEVGDFLSQISAYCEEGLTVLGTVGIAKLKPHEMYDNPRQLVAGSSVWERASSTNFIIRSINPKDIADGRRLLYVSLKNSPSFAVKGDFDDNGMLIFEDYAYRQDGADIAKIIGARNRNGAGKKQKRYEK